MLSAVTKHGHWWSRVHALATGYMQSSFFCGSLRSDVKMIITINVKVQVTMARGHCGYKVQCARSITFAAAATPARIASTRSLSASSSSILRVCWALSSGVIVRNRLRMEGTSQPSGHRLARYLVRHEWLDEPGVVHFMYTREGGTTTNEW